MSLPNPAGNGLEIRSANHRPQYRLWFAILTAAGFFLWLCFNHANPMTRKLVSDLFGLLGASLAAYWSFWPATGAVLSSHGFWQRLKTREWGADLIGLYFICYSFGMVYWTYAEFILKQEAPFPCLSDAFYLTGYTCLMVGILLLPSHKMPSAMRGRVLLDGLMIMMGIISFSWYFILGPNLQASGISVFAKIITVSYPLADLAMLVCLLIMLAHSPVAHQRTTRLSLCWGLIIIIVADGVYGYLTLKNGYASGNIVDGGWVLGQLLMASGIASLRKSWNSAPAEANGERAQPRQMPILWRSMLPYTFVPAMIGLVIYTFLQKGDESLQPGVYICSAILICIVLARQLLALVENHRLYQELEGTNAKIALYASSLEGALSEVRVTQKQLLWNNQELAAANGRLQALATRDGMTGLPNHRTFQERLREELANAETTGAPFSLLLMDVDKFKQYNDTYGHPAGDEALRIVARLLSENMRASDLPARYGGEEFAVLMPGAGHAQTLAMAERIRAAVEAEPFPHRAVTLSIGTAVWEAGIDDPQRLIFKADKALYAAKHNGRNCVWMANNDSEVSQRAA